MAKTVEFEGTTHEFPDDFSDADIGSALKSMHPVRPEPFADYRPMSAKDKLVSAGKQLGSAIISPITGIPGALREVATFASDPNAWSKKHFDASSANEGPGEMGSNPLVDAEGNAMLAVATGRGRGTDAMGLPRGKAPAPIRARMGIPDDVPPPAEPPASASGGQSLPRRILDASRAARKTFKDVKEAPERFIDSMAGKAVDLYDGKVDAPKPPAPPPVPAGALKPPPEPPAPAPQPDAIQARRAAHAATRDAIMDRMAPPEPPAATSTPEPPQYERGKIGRGLPPPKAPAPPAGADYVMPEPANAPAANVSEPEGFTGPGPRMPAPGRAAAPQMPPPTAPPVKPPPVKPEVPPAGPSAALGAFGIEDAKTISKARARQLATDAGIADVDQFKMLRDEGYKIQDDPFGSGETQRNRRGKVTSPEPMKPGAKPETPQPPKAEAPRVISGQFLTKQEMINRGADGYLSRALEMEIPLDKIDGLEPVPASDEPGGKYTPGRQITQPIEVQYDPQQGAYILNGGNHRIAQARANGQSTIRAFVENPPKEARTQAAQLRIKQPPVEVEKLPTAAETEAAIRKQKMTELGNALGLSETPAAKPAKAKGKPRAALEDPLGIRDHDANG